MDKMGFLKTESMDEKLEQMKFWKIMLQSEIDEAKEKRSKIVRNGVENNDKFDSKYIHSDEDNLK